jgi:glyoxylase-like metal-dependent hydrolase (beta-lactamase superfamily II)
VTREKAPRLEVVAIPVGPFVMNCTLLLDRDTGEGIVLDPGDEPERVLPVVRRKGTKVVALVATHGHLDHVGRAAEFARALDAPLFCHRGDLFLVERLAEQAALFGLERPETPRVDRFLEDRDVLECGKVRFEVLHVPGHSPGSIALLGEGRLFSGDVLFSGSVGRTDLWGGDFERLERSIRERFYGAGDDVVVHPGHGSTTTIGTERRTNPFVRNA